MTIPLVLTLIGDDRPGLVNAVSETVAAHGGAWLESRLAHLAGKFAGILLIEAPEAEIDALAAALRRLEAAGLKVSAERGARELAPERARLLSLTVVGNDRPGIVRDLTQALIRLGVNIEEFSSGLEKAAFTGADMFRATAEVRLPDGLSSDELRKTLERLAGEIMVDVAFSDSGARA